MTLTRDRETGEISSYEAAELLVNHKGRECWVKGILCQERYCSECEFYINYDRILLKEK